MAYSLIINGSNVLGDVPAGDSRGPVSLVSFERNFDDPAELVIRVDTSWRAAPWACDTPARLERDGVTVFEGLIYLAKPIASQRDYPAVEIPIHDRSHALRFEPAMNNDGYPEIILPTGTLGSVVSALFALTNVGAKMVEKGVEAVANYVAGADGVRCLPITLGGESIDEAIRKIAAAAPGVRVFMAPSGSGLSRYQFVRLYSADSYDVVIDVTRVDALTIQQSLEGRGGAVRTLGGKTIGSADVETLEDELLTPGWVADPNESQWSLERAHELTHEGAYANPTLADVYRRFTWTRDDITQEMIEAVHVETVHDAIPENSLWVERAVERFDMENKTLWLKSPAIAMRLRRNPVAYRHYMHRGRSVGLAAKMRIKQAGTATTPIYISSHRVPEAGYSGRAYQMAPIRCANEIIVRVPDGVDVETYCQDAHAALSEPTVSGDVPIDGDLPADLFLLGKRINIVTASHGATGLETLAAPLLGISLAFDPAVRSTLQFNRDDSQMLAEGEQ